ncbi:MAG: hypothetical protein WAU70_05685 [Flavobacteriales bacterium]
MRSAAMVAGCLVALCSLKAQELDTVAHHYPTEERHDEITLLAGYHQGHDGFAELGLGRNQWGVNHHPYDLAYYLGGELRVDRPELVGVKVGAYVDGGFAMGVQLIQYFDGGDRCTVFRPEIGIGLFKFKMTYAYNVRLTKPRLDGINTHMLSISYAFRLKRLPGDGQQW